MNKSGVIKSVELAQPLSDVRVFQQAGNSEELLCYTDVKGRWELPEKLSEGKILFRKPGYVDKAYLVENMPYLVRLLENKLVGYQEKLWFKPGESARACIHAPELFRATLCRHGSKKIKIQTWENNPEHTQATPDGLFVENGLSWEPNFSYTIPENASPGIYSLLLESKHQKSFAIPFVVSAPEEKRSQKPLLVLASTNNWQCYNVWGGRNRYRNFEEDKSDPYLRDSSQFTEFLAFAGKLTPRPIVRAVKKIMGMPQSDPPWKFSRLSINRPFTNCALEAENPDEPFTNHLAAGEWRVLAWLERAGYDYDIVTGYELHQNPDLLDQYRGIILSTHCEYWSEQMYEGLKKYHNNHGLSIINLSGNSIYREVDFFEDGSLHCKSLKFEESVEDETQLLGVRFTEGDMGSCAPYQIQKPDHWVFDGLGVGKNEIFGKHSLNKKTARDDTFYDSGRLGTVSGLSGEGASGWETDKLSRTAPPDFIRIAKGQNKGGGADMIVREPEGNRGGFFSASSITFGGALLIDEVCAGIVKNVLDRFISLPQKKVK